MTARYLRLLAAGFRPEQARALAVNHDVIDVWPMGNLDLFFEPQSCNSTADLSPGGAS